VQRLEDLGERAIVQSLVNRHLGAASHHVLVGVGDDAAIFSPLAPGMQLVATVDACPTPVVDLLGVGSMYDWGRLAGVISLSDLAAMGATPLGLLSSTYMDPKMTAEEYEDFLRGLSDVCMEFDTPIVGGNIREGPSFAATTVAIGTCSNNATFTRSGAGFDDTLIAVGHSGLFWSGILDIMRTAETTGLDEAQRTALYRPRPKLPEAHILREAGVVTSAVDCSDGLGAAIEEICRSSAIGATIQFERFDVEPAVIGASREFGVRIERLLLAWGDWQLLVTVGAADLDSALTALHDSGYRAFVVGETHSEEGIFEAWEGIFQRRPVVDTLASTRFERTSYLSAGLDGYVRRLGGTAG
jgi:thiamine-monophosphate kinase